MSSALSWPAHVTKETSAQQSDVSSGLTAETLQITSADDEHLLTTDDDVIRQSADHHTATVEQAPVKLQTTTATIDQSE